MSHCKQEFHKDRNIHHKIFVLRMSPPKIMASHKLLETRINALEHIPWQSQADAMIN